MERNRLTWRPKKAGQTKTADPNSLGRPDRENPPVEKYMNYDFTTNHPYPDLRHQWKTDKRMETGHPAPLEEYQEKTANYLEKKAQVALKLAESRLPKASSEDQVKQALDYMEMSDEALINSLRRAVEDEEKIAGETDMPEEAEEVEVEEVVEEPIEEPAAEPAAEPIEGEEEVDQEVLESVNAILAEANTPTKVEVVMGVMGGFDPETVEAVVANFEHRAEEEVPAEELVAEEEPAEELELEETVEEPAEEEVTEEPAEEEEEFITGFEGIDLNPVAQSDVEAMPIGDTAVMSEEDEELLSQLFSPKNTSVQNFVNNKTASAKGRPAPKKGVKSLGGVRNKKANSSPADEIRKLESLWRSDPSVGHIFD